MKTSYRLRAAVGAGAFLSAMMLAACGGGTGAAPTPTAATPTAPTATATPLVAATAGPGVPTPAPSAAATLPPTTTQNIVLFGALAAAPAKYGLSVARRAQSGVQGLALAGTETTLIESTGMNWAQWGADNIVWATNITTGQDVAESSLIASGTNNLQINDPPVTPLSPTCTGVNAGGAWCTAHPKGWYWGTDGGLIKPLGQQRLTFSFGDGSTGSVVDDVYNGVKLTCGQSVQFTGGITQLATGASADITYNCANQTVDFPHGVVLVSPATFDQFGMNTQITNILAAVAVPLGAATSLSYTTYQSDANYVLRTADGGFAKFVPNGGGGGLLIGGIGLHAKANGSYAY